MGLGDAVSRAKSEADYLRVREHVLGLMEGGQLPAGRLPTERELAERLSVGRGITRRVLGELEAQGLIRRHVGRGTFVGSDDGALLGNSDDRPIEHRSASARSPAEYIEARLRFEPELAWMIVANATAADFDQIGNLLRRAEGVQTMAEFEDLDRAFHAALVDATHNSLAIDMYKPIDDVRRYQHAVWSRLHGDEQTGVQRQVFVREHREILDALMRRDASAARDAWSRHIRETKRRIVDY